MELKTLNSRSEGNGYILEDEASALIIEAGVKFSLVKQALDFNIGKIAGCIVTHEHLDHSKYVHEYLSSGIDVWLSSGTNSALKLKSNTKLPLLTGHGHKFMLGGFKIMPFNVQHDAKEPLGYMISHPGCGNVLFMTDTHYTKYTFSGLNHILIECNFDQEILDKMVLDGKLEPIVRKRIMESHISLQTCKEILRANDLSNVRNIVLLHLSDGNSDAKRFKEEIESLTGIKAHIAEKGLIVDMGVGLF